MKQAKRIAGTKGGPHDNGYALCRDLTPQLIPIEGCKLLGREVRKHPPQQLRKLASSLERFGFVLPVLVDDANRVVGGWGLVLAARRLGLREVPAVSLGDLSEAELRTLRLALNRVTEDAEWDHETLALEFSDLVELDPQIELEVTGFEMGEIDILLDGDGIDEEDDLPEIENRPVPVTRDGDLWILGDHHLLCGDALNDESYARVLGSDKADMVIADPPYYLAIEGNVSGLGSVKHADFAMASGELSPDQFRQFLRTSLGHAADHSQSGAIHFICMDWRHQREMLAAGDEIYSELKNLCIWNKSNAGMGALYRSKHEFVFAFKVGTAPHVNNVALGRYGRNRTNVWDYASQNTLTGTGKGKLALHPTVKPVAMIADAIRDCSNRNDIILYRFYIRVS